MRALIVLAMLAAVAIANPIVNIRVNVDSPNDEIPPGQPGQPGPNPDPNPPPNPEPEPEQPPPQPYTKQDLKRAVPLDDDEVEVVNPVAPSETLVNIEVFVNNRRQGDFPINPDVPNIPDVPPPIPY